MKNNDTSRFFEDEQSATDVAAIAATASTEFCQFIELPSHGIYRLAKAMRHGRWWLLKGLKQEFLTQSNYSSWLYKEFCIVVQMRHPGIVDASSFETIEGFGPCIVMEWIDGVNLDEWLHPISKTNAVPSRSRRRRVFDQLMTIVEYIHSHQVVHRDIKPSNIMITHNGENVKVIDFGLSDTDSYAMLKQSAGTEGYISPEQQMGGEADVRNDIYSLGCVLEDMNLGWAAKRVANRCKRPLEQRYANVGEMRRDLRRKRHTPYYILCACVIALIALACFLYNTYHASENEEQPFIEIGNTVYEIVSETDSYMTVVGGQANDDGTLVVHSMVSFNDKWYKVINIAPGAFMNTNFPDVDIPLTVTAIGDNAFMNSGLTSVAVSNSVFYIGRWAFNGCQSLESIVLGSSVRIIGMDAFPNGESALHDITVTSYDPPHLSNTQQLDFNRVRLHVPAGSEQRYAEAKTWKRFTHIEAY